MSINETARKLIKYAMNSAWGLWGTHNAQDLHPLYPRFTHRINIIAGCELKEICEGNCAECPRWFQDEEAVKC